MTRTSVFKDGVSVDRIKSEEEDGLQTSFVDVLNKLHLKGASLFGPFS